MQVSAIRNYSNQNIKNNNDDKVISSPSFQAKIIGKKATGLTLTTLLGGLGLIGLNNSKTNINYTVLPDTGIYDRIQASGQELEKIKEYKKAKENSKYDSIKRKYSVNLENLRFVEKFLSNKLFTENKSLQTRIPYIISEINNSFNNSSSKTTPEIRTNMAIAILEIYEEYPQANQSKIVQENIGSILCNVVSGRVEGLDIAANWLKDEKLHTKEYTDALRHMTIKIESSGEFTKKYLSDEKLYTNKNLSDVAGYISSLIPNKTVAEGRVKILDKFLSSPYYYENPVVVKQLAYIIRDISNTEKALKELDRVAKESLNG